MRVIATFLSILLLPLAAAYAEDRLEAQVDGETMSLGLTAAVENLDTSGPIWWQQHVSFLGADYARVHISVNGEVPPETMFQLMGTDGEALSYPLSGVGPHGLWTGIVLGGMLTFNVVGGPRPTGMKLVIDQVTLQKPVGTPYSTWGGKDESLPINDPAVPETVRQLGRAVAKLVFQSEGQPRICTGFLVSPNQLLTNEHCVHSEDACESLSAIFGYAVGPNDHVRLGRQYACTGFDVQRSAHDLDATLITLEGTPGTQYGTLASWGADPVSTEQLMIIEYPGGEPERVSSINCATLAVPVEGRAPDIDFTHSCDTAGGSSGSPILNQAGQLVGLHHFGFNEEGGGSWTDNRGVRIAKLGPWLMSKLTP